MIYHGKQWKIAPKKHKQIQESTSSIKESHRSPRHVLVGSEKAGQSEIKPSMITFDLDVWWLEKGKDKESL